MDKRTLRHLTYGLFILLVVNLAVAYARNSVDYTAVAVSVVGLMGILHGASKRDKGDGDDPP